MNKPITIRAQMKFVLVHGLDKIVKAHVWSYKIWWRQRGGAPGLPMPVSATGRQQVVHVPDR